MTSSSRLRFRLPTPPTPKQALLIGIALMLGLACGAAAAGLNVPLPWMLGPMLGCAVAAFAGLPMGSPNALRTLAIPVLGVMLGSSFHPGMLAQTLTWSGTLLLLPPFLVTAGLASYAVFRKLGRYDRTTAIFSAAPGGLNEMILVGSAAGGNETRIALAHAIRVVIVISTVALGVALIFGTSSSANGGRPFNAFSEFGAGELGALVACAVLGATAGRRLRLPASGLFGPMILSAALHLTGLVTQPPPTVVVIAAQVVIGTTLGCRFAGATLADTGRDMLVSILATLAMLPVTIVFAGLVALLTVTPVTQAVLAFSPGGLAEMGLLALALGGDVAYVATLHLARIVLVLLSIPALRRLAGAKEPAA